MDWFLIRGEWGRHEVWTSQGWRPWHGSALALTYGTEAEARAAALANVERVQVARQRPDGEVVDLIPLTFADVLDASVGLTTAEERERARMARVGDFGTWARVP